MRFRILLLSIASSALLWAGQKISVDQLMDAVRSSLAMKYEDAKIAKYLKTVTLTEPLSQ